MIKDINKLVLDAVRRLRSAMARRGKAGRPGAGRGSTPDGGRDPRRRPSPWPSRPSGRRRRGDRRARGRN